MIMKAQIIYLFICTQSALHVSGKVFAHHQEHLSVFTVSDIVHLWCYRPVSMDEMEHFIRDIGLQQHKWTISEAVSTVKYSWWWAKTSPETCRADWVKINKPKICILLVINYELYYSVSADKFMQRNFRISFANGEMGERLSFAHRIVFITIVCH